jgi:hypothetical protein
MLKDLVDSGRPPRAGTASASGHGQRTQPTASARSRMGSAVGVTAHASRCPLSDDQAVTQQPIALRNDHVPSHWAAANNQAMAPTVARFLLMLRSTSSRTCSSVASLGAASSSIRRGRNSRSTEDALTLSRSKSAIS